MCGPALGLAVLGCHSADMQEAGLKSHGLLPPISASSESSSKFCPHPLVPVWVSLLLSPLRPPKELLYSLPGVVWTDISRWYSGWVTRNQSPSGCIF